MNGIEYFIKRLGISKNQATELIYKLAGYIKLDNLDTDEAHRMVLDYRIKYITENLGFTKENILKYPRIITLDCGEKGISETCLPTKIDLLVNFYGFSYDAIRAFPNILGYDCNPESTSPTALIQKVRFFQNNLGFTQKQFNDCPYIFAFDIYGDDIHSIPSKIEFYKKYGIDKKALQNSPILLTLNCDKESINPTSIINKIIFLNEHLGFTDKHIRAFPIILSADCNPNSKSPTALINKIKFLKSTLGFENKHFQDCPPILGMDCDPHSTYPTSIAQKLKFYKEFLDFDAEQFRAFPQLLSLDCSTENENPLSVINKANFYLEYVGFSKEILKKHPNLLGYDCNPHSTSPSSIINKLKSIENAGISMDFVRNVPLILGCPSKSLKIRNMLYYITEMDKYAQNAAPFIQNEQKTYARYAYFEEIGHPTAKKVYYLQEKLFQKRYGVSSEDLIKRYPLDQNAIKLITQKYNEKCNKNLTFTNQEVAQIVRY
ncbi:MAG: hypothetical protein J6C13_02875 [Clostridia bacterium]|nr:hypothetical protein [Clostridia bacterium]